MSDDTTIARTLWSDTLFETLTIALQKRGDDDVVGILREIRQKKYKKAQVMRYCEKRLDAAALRRLKSLINRMGDER